MNRASILAIVILILILLFRECDHASNISRIRSQYNDTLTTYVDKNGVATATIQVIKEENHNKFLKIKSDKESIQALQKEVKVYKKKLKDATYAGISTNVNSSTISIVDHHDTIIKQDTVFLFPKYQSTQDNEWIKWEIIASKDSVEVNLKVINKIIMSQITKREGLFKPEKTFVEFKTMNPYTETNELERFSIEKKEPKIIIGPSVGVSISGKPTIGIGVTYPLLRF